jgi:hypothetical protein
MARETYDFLFLGWREMGIRVLRDSLNGRDVLVLAAIDIA